MNKKELFKKNYPEYVTEKGEFLSPYWDLFSAGIECATYELNKGCIQTLTKENAELKADNEEWEKASDKWKSLYESTNNQLTKAKELIENIIRVTWGEGWTYSLDWKVKAEQFLKEIKEK